MNRLCHITGSRFSGCLFIYAAQNTYLKIFLHDIVQNINMLIQLSELPWSKGGMFFKD